MYLAQRLYALATWRWRGRKFDSAEIAFILDVSFGVLSFWWLVQNKKTVSVGTVILDQPVWAEIEGLELRRMFYIGPCNTWIIEENKSTTHFSDLLSLTLRFPIALS